MKGFVHGRDRAASPQQQNGQPINPERQAIAANAKVSMKKGPFSQQTHRPQAPISIQARGLGNAQNSSAAMQHEPPRQHLGQGQKQDMFDTDAESIDTTVNQSVVQVEDIPTKYPHDQQHGGDVDLGEVSDEDEAGSYEGEGGEDGEDEIDTYPLTKEDVEYLQHEGKEHLTRRQAVEFLFQTRQQELPTIDGDSYPSTTDGNPTEWERGPGLTSEDHDNGGLVSPSPRHRGVNSRQPVVALPVHHGPVSPGISNQSKYGSNKLFKQSAHIRGQQRASTNPHQQPGQDSQSDVAPLLSSQLPSYSQANRDTTYTQTSNPHARSNHHVTFNQAPQFVPHQAPNHLHATAQPAKSIRASVATHHPSARNSFIPEIQQQHVELVPVQDLNIRPDGDYDVKALHAMSYDQLKNESFDANPRAINEPLFEALLQKPLIERLSHVQHNLDAGKQSEFFRTLSTTDWEDAGDWFLDKFGSIIQRTKDARHKKRKLAQEFEAEIEKRHKYVSKKQHQVKDAMDKMQSQGEGLVPRSPRPSKSPKPKKR
jgi:hypothetical protein